MITFSIITVSFNAGSTLARTIRSVASQTYNTIEYFIIDGGSQDNTHAIVNKYSKCIDYYVSEKDEGIYDAMNKGIKKATGDYILLLNADDYLVHEQTIAKVADFISHSKKYPVIYGDVIKSGNRGKRYKKASDNLCIHDFFVMPLYHPALLVRNDIYQQFGFYDTNYRLAADYEFCLRLFKQGVRFKKMDIPVSVFSTGGRSEVDLEAWHEMRKAMVSHSINDYSMDIRYYAKLIKTFASIQIRNLIS